MIVWDRGRWLPDGDPHKGLAKGHLAVRARRRAAQGPLAPGAHEAATRRRKKTEPWLLIKAEDEFARAAGRARDHRRGDDLAAQRPHHRGAGRARRRARRPRGARRRRQAARKRRAARRRQGARRQEGPAADLPASRAWRRRARGRRAAPKWIHEIKHDGYRIAGAHRRRQGPAPHPQGARLDRPLPQHRRGAAGARSRLGADRRRDHRRGRRPACRASTICRPT